MPLINIEAYPLYWPDGWPRTPPSQRRRARFKATQWRATQDLLNELKLMKAQKPIISTNIVLRRDGLPMAGRAIPTDPGVAIYFDRKGKQQVIACDQFDIVGDNIRAVGLTIEALRAIARHGATTLLDRAFQGFAALPAHKSWSDILGIRADMPNNEVEKIIRDKTIKHHPDRGGAVEVFQEIQTAAEMFRRERGVSL